MNPVVHERGRDAAPRSKRAWVFNDMQAWEAGWHSGQRVAFLPAVKRERQGGPKEATMKRLTKYMAAAAAVLMMTAGVVSAQSLMKAEVPFAFSVGNKVVEPGTYQVGLVSGLNNSVLHVYNVKAGSGYLLVAQSRGDASRSEEH